MRDGKREKRNWGKSGRLLVRANQRWNQIVAWDVNTRAMLDRLVAYVGVGRSIYGNHLHLVGAVIVIEAVIKFVI